MTWSLLVDDTAVVAVDVGSVVAAVVDDDAGRRVGHDVPRSLYDLTRHCNNCVTEEVEFAVVTLLAAAAASLLCFDARGSCWLDCWDVARHCHARDDRGLRLMWE